MVVPAELGHAQYAREVLRFLLERFRRISVRMFREKLFPELSEDTFLLLCEDFGDPCTWFSVAAAPSIERIHEADNSELPVDIQALRSGQIRLRHYLVPPKTRHLYACMAEEKGVQKLGDAADVGIGYVTGCNDYFHMTFAEARKWCIPASCLKPAVLTLGDFKGNIFTSADWRKLLESGERAYLLSLPGVSHDRLPRGVVGYLEQGIKLGVQSRFKCRVRNPWYSVPHARTPHAFLSYMSGQTPKLVGNRANLVAPNTLHLVQFAKSCKPSHFLVGWYSSLTKLSCELEGHALGGGMLKLEPSEAEKVLVALPYPADAARLAEELDRSLRAGETEKALDIADCRILRRRFALSAVECARLRDAAAQLQAWRLHK